MEKFIEETITKFNKMMEYCLYMSNPQPVRGETVQGVLKIQKECKAMGTMTHANELVRESPKIELEPEC